MPRRPPAGNFGYALNVLLLKNVSVTIPPVTATVGYVATNSVRMERDFVLKSFQLKSNSASNTCLLILGTTMQDWFGDYVYSPLVSGYAAIPHFLPGEGTQIPEGDFIVVKAQNLGATQIILNFLFQGVHV